MAAARRKDPAALQMVNAVNKLRIVMQNFQKGLNRAFRDTNDLLKGSDLFRKSNTTTMLHFFKNAIPLLTKIKNAIRFVARSFKGGGPAPAGGGPPSAPTAPSPFTRPSITPDMLDNLSLGMRSTALGVLGLGDTLKELQRSKLHISPADLGMIEGEFQTLLKEASSLLKKTISTKKGTSSIANDFELTEQNISQTLQDFRDIVRSSHFTATDFWNVGQRIGDIVHRLGLAQHRMEKTAESIDKAAKGYDRVTGAVGTQIKDLLKVHGREFMLGSVEGVRTFIKQVAGLNDLIIDLRKTAQFDLPPEKWRKDIIGIAQAYNTAAKPIYALPTDIGEAFVAVAKTGIKSEQVVKDLGKTIFEMSKATTVSTDAAAALGHTMTTTWRLSADEAKQFLSSMVQTSRTVNIPLDDLIERTKSLGNQFLLSFKKGDVEGKDRVRFLNDLSNAVGSLNVVGEDSTKVLSNMITALQNTPEAAKLLAPFKVNVYAVQEALTKGDMAGAFRLLLKDMSLLKSASNNSSDALRNFAEMAQIPFETLQNTIANSDQVLKTFEVANMNGLKDFASSAEYLRNLAASESEKMGSSFENWLKKFWTNVGQNSKGSVGWLINTFYKFKDALIPAYFALKLFGLGFEPIMKTSGLVLTWLGQYIIGAVAATLNTGLFNGALAATSFTGFLKGVGSGLLALFGFGTAAGGATVSFRTLALAVWSATWPILAVVAAVAAVIIIWKKWDKIIGWFTSTFPNVSKVIGSTVDYITTAFSNVWSYVKTVFTSMWTLVAPVLRDIGKMFSTFWKLLVVNLQEDWQMTIDGARSVFGAIWKILQPVISIITKVFKFYWTVYSFIAKTLAGVFGKVLKKALGLTDRAVKSLTGSMKDALAKHKTMSKEVKKGQTQGASAIKNTTSTVQVLGQKVDSFTGKAENLKEALTEAFDPDARAFAAYLNKAEGDFGSFFKRIGAKAKAFAYRTIGHFAPDVEAAIAQASKTYNVAPNLIRSVIMQESKGDPFAQSGVGARGLMQLMPGTARDLGLNTLEDIYDVNKNVAAGTKYLGQLLSMYGGDVNKALAAYNWGMGHLNNYLKGMNIQMPAETRDYLEKVNMYLAQFEEKYPTRTDLKDLMAVAPLMDLQKVVTPEPATKVAQPAPSMMMPDRAPPQKDVVAAVNESTKATQELTEIVKAGAQNGKKPPMLLPKTKQEDQLMALIAQYQT